MPVLYERRSDKAVAVQVESEARSANKIPHVTLAHSKIGRPKDSNDIPPECWTDLRNSPYAIVLTGVIGEHKTLTLAGGAPKSRASPATQGPRTSPTSPKIAIGVLVRKHHPQLTGKGIGDAVRVVTEWMVVNDVMNSVEYETQVEEYIQTLTFADTTTTSQQ